MTTALILGRILFGGYFIYSGYNHLAHVKMLSGYAGSKHVPLPTVSVVISGIMLLLGGLGVLFWTYTFISLVLIALFLIVATPTMHNFWADTDTQTEMSDKINFGKNLALLGAALMLMSFV